MTIPPNSTPFLSMILSMRVRSVLALPLFLRSPSRKTNSTWCPTRMSLPFMVRSPSIQWIVLGARIRFAPVIALPVVTDIFDASSWICIRRVAAGSVRAVGLGEIRSRQGIGPVGDVLCINAVALTPAVPAADADDAAVRDEELASAELLFFVAEPLENTLPPWITVSAVPLKTMVSPCFIQRPNRVSRHG